MVFNSSKSEKGITLVELLVALAVMAVLLSVVSSLIITSTQVQTAAVNQSSFSVKSQKLLATMVDGKTGLISAIEYRLFGPQNGYQLALAYVVNVDGADTIYAYQYLGDTIYRSEPVVGAVLEAPDGLGSPVLSGIDRFVIDERAAPTLTFEICAGETVLKTAVTPRN